MLKRLLEKGLNPNDQENGGCSAIRSCLNDMSWTGRFNAYSWEQDKDGKYDTSDSRERMKAIHLLVKHGAKWIPEDKYEMNSARRSLLGLKADYAIEFLWIMSKYKACGKESIQGLFNTPTIKKHTFPFRTRLLELLSTWE